MPLTQETILALVRLYAQTLGLSLLFVGGGAWLHRTCLVRGNPAADEPLSLTVARAFFLGLSAFLLLFVFLSRGTSSARAGLWLSLALMGGVCLWQVVAAGVVPWRRVALSLTALLLLVGFFSVTNATLWISWNPSEPTGTPRLAQHFGSVHSGRYANYAVFIAEHDRIPFVPQNAGQSMLCGVHLLLGLDCPLAALMVWVPFSLAFLALLLFGFFRAQHFAVASCLAATFLVLYCNVALSLVHVLVFDNGSPLAFVGYTDMIVAVATFLILGMAARDSLSANDGRGPWAALLFPGLLGVTWCWYAPQNVVLAAFACTGAAVAWWPRRREKGFGPLLPLSTGPLAFALGVAIGATQLGAFLPHAFREDVGSPVYVVRPRVRVRPYTQHATSHWTHLRRNVELRTGRDGMHRPHFYEDAIRQARPLGRDEAARRVTWLFEDNLWTTLRMVCFPVLGLVLFGLSLRGGSASPEEEGERAARRAWLWLSGSAFLGGFAISYGLELDGVKWWLARFLVAGSVLGLTCLALVMLRRGCWRGGMRIVAWAALLVVATWGPVAELAAVFHRNCLAAHADPIGHRLNVLVQSKGPYHE